MYFRLMKEIFHCHLLKNTQYEPPQNKFKSNIKIVQTYNSYLVRRLSQVPCFFAPNIWCFLSRGSQDTTLSLLFLRSQMKDLKHCLTDVSLDEDFGTSRIRSVIPSCPCWTTLGFLSHYPKRSQLPETNIASENSWL